MEVKASLLLAVWLCVMCATTGTAGAETEEEDVVTDAVSKRGFLSYYYNYLDEMAMSICASIPNDGPGHIFAIRRKCGTRIPCNKICSGSFLYRANKFKWLKKSRWQCIESLHVYKTTRRLKKNQNRDSDPYLLGLQVYRYHSCFRTGCGPNYCCCRHY